MPKKSKPTITTGKLPLNKSTAKSLDEIWGIQSSNPYKTDNAEEYRKSLAEMNMVDLQAHAVSLYVIPRDDRDALIRGLVKEFEKRNFKYTTISQSSEAPTNNREELLKILYEGK